MMTGKVALGHRQPTRQEPTRVRYREATAPSGWVAIPSQGELSFPNGRCYQFIHLGPVVQRGLN